MIFSENRSSFMVKHRLKWLYSVDKTIWNNFRIRSMNLVHCGLHCWFCASALCEIKTPSDFICLAVPSVHTFRVQGVYVQGDWYKCYIYCVRMVVLGKWPYLLIFSKVYNYFSFEIDLVMCERIWRYMLDPLYPKKLK